MFLVSRDTKNAEEHDFIRVGSERTQKKSNNLGS